MVHGRIKRLSRTTDGNSETVVGAHGQFVVERLPLATEKRNNRESENGKVAAGDLTRALIDQLESFTAPSPTYGKIPNISHELIS